VDDQRDNTDESLLDKAKDAIGELFGGNREQSAANTPGAAGGDMGMDAHTRSDVGMGVTDVHNGPYGGSAGEQALDLAEQEIPGTSSREGTSGPAAGPLDV
jgi:hypothetical protein